MNTYPYLATHFKDFKPDSRPKRETWFQITVSFVLSNYYEGSGKTPASFEYGKPLFQIFASYPQHPAFQKLILFLSQSGEKSVINAENVFQKIIEGNNNLLEEAEVEKTLTDGLSKLTVTGG